MRGFARDFPYGLSLEPIQTRNVRDYNNTSSPSLMRVDFSTSFPSSSPSDPGTGPIGAFSSGQRRRFAAAEPGSSAEHVGAGGHRPGRSSAWQLAATEPRIARFVSGLCFLFSNGSFQKRHAWPRHPWPFSYTNPKRQRVNTNPKRKRANTSTTRKRVNGHDRRFHAKTPGRI